MQITIVTQGTHGDVQPYVALGRGLRAAGHTVTIASSRSFQPFIESHGLTFAPVAGDPKEMLDSYAKVTEGGSPLDNLKFIRAMLPRMGADILQASEGADLLLSNFNMTHLTYSVAEKRRIPFIDCGLLPMLATQDYPNPHIIPQPPKFWPRALNRATYTPVDQLLWQPFRTVINRFRVEQLGLPPYPFNGYAKLMLQRNIPRLEAYSRHIVPPASDWGNRVHVTGFWFLDHNPAWQPPESLLRFLETRQTPLYIGFGSMNFGSAAERTGVILEALARTGQRAVVGMGWGGLEQGSLPENVYPLEHAPHDWLFPRVAGAIHHGGAGTTAAALRAGIPQFIVTFFGDQPYWGRQIARLGLGPSPIPRKQLSVDNFAAAINSLTSQPNYHHNASLLCEKIAAENGIAQAIATIERVIS